MSNVFGVADTSAARRKRKENAISTQKMSYSQLLVQTQLSVSQLMRCLRDCLADILFEEPRHVIVL